MEYRIQLENAREHAYSLALEDIDVSHWDLFRTDTLWPYFERLRREKPVHFHEQSTAGQFWSVTRYDLIRAIDEDHENFSSEPAITLDELLPDESLPMFIAMDQPKHNQQRKVVAPVTARRNLHDLEPTIRSRVEAILDGLPVGESFNWVKHVSIELTTQMLATLFDFPFDERYKLTRWSDVATSPVKAGLVSSHEQRSEELFECLSYFKRLRDERASKTPGNDLLSMLAHGKATRHMPDLEFLGNLLLLIVGGNDTTRNSISGGVLALNQFPEQYARLRKDPSLIPNMVPEIIRWQTPLAYMRRTALRDTELHGQHIKAGDRVVMWYVSGNRDEDVFVNADQLVIDRPNARNHLSFGFGIHRCMGNRVAELQLRVLWEEIMKRFSMVEVVGEPERNMSNLIRGYTRLPVKVHPL
ncbi:MAG: cytochrome P450 [Gammaproteobacteria bacterium]|jgi:cytochrome P450